jgi:hypothetical protein
MYGTCVCTLFYHGSGEGEKTQREQEHKEQTAQSEVHCVF